MRLAELDVSTCKYSFLRYIFKSCPRVSTCALLVFGHFLCIAIPAYSQTDTIPKGRITGVIDAAVKPNRTVFLFWQKEGAPSEATRGSGYAPADAQGAFEVRALDEGNYRICVRSSDPEILDPCVWDAPVRVSLGRGRAMEAAGVKVPVKRGIILRFEFSDPEKLLAHPENPGAGGGINAGLWLPSGEYIPMRPVAISGESRAFEVTVPPRTGLRVQVQSKGVRLDQTLQPDDPDRIPVLDNPAGFALWSGTQSRTVRFVLRRPS